MRRTSLWTRRSTDLQSERQRMNIAEVLDDLRRLRDRIWIAQHDYALEVRRALQIQSECRKSIAKSAVAKQAFISVAASTPSLIRRHARPSSIRKRTFMPPYQYAEVTFRAADGSGIATIPLNEGGFCTAGRFVRQDGLSLAGTKIGDTLQHDGVPITVTSFACLPPWKPRCRSM
jgi:hypothetical protein